MSSRHWKRMSRLFGVLAVAGLSHVEDRPTIAVDVVDDVLN